MFLASGAEGGINWEMLIALTNIPLVLVSLALCVVTALDNNALSKIAVILAKRKRGVSDAPCGKHSKPESTDAS